MSPRHPVKQHSETTESGNHHPQSLKTSDDAKWRVGLHAMDPQVGAKFDGVKLFCAKDAIENAADGEFRWADQRTTVVVCVWLTCPQLRR